LCLAKTTVVVLCPRRLWRGQCHGNIPTCCAGVRYMVPCTAHPHNRLVCCHDIDIAYGEQNVYVDRRHTHAHTHTHTHTQYVPNIYFSQSKWIMQK
jgi:hypothetical protein